MTRISKKLTILAAAVMAAAPLYAQVTGGQNAFSYLELSGHPHVASLGGIVPAGPLDDAGFVLQNPALLNPEMHNQLALNYNLYYANIGIANLEYAYHVAPLKTDFGLGIQYLNYGHFDGTDIYGNNIGDVHAADYSVNLSASRQYLTHWRYGATLKLAHSKLADRQSMAVLADVGVVYNDTASLWTFGVVAKNMGVILKKYNPNLPQEPLPFDLQVGLSKQLRNVPLKIYVTGHHLYQWDIRYDNPADVKNQTIFGSEDTTTEDKSYFVDKLFRHINIGAELLIAKRLTISVGYNHLHRGELGTDEQKGLAGFSFGGAVNLNKFRVYYTRSYLATAGAFNQIGLSMQLNKFFDLGSKTGPWGWNKQY